MQELGAPTVPTHTVKNAQNFTLPQNLRELGAPTVPTHTVKNPQNFTLPQNLSLAICRGLVPRHPIYKMGRSVHLISPLHLWIPQMWIKNSTGTY